MRGTLAKCFVAIAMASATALAQTPDAPREGTPAPLRHSNRWAKAAEAIVLSDLSVVQPHAAISDVRAPGCWKLLDYEAEGIRGRAISALPYTNAQPVTLPLNRQGRYAIYLGLGGNGRFGWDQQCMIRVKLSGDTAYQHRIYSAGHDDIDEVFFGCADVTGRDLHLAQMRFAAVDNGERTVYDNPCTLMYVRLVPLTDQEAAAVEEDLQQRQTKRLTATIDGFSWLAAYCPTTEDEFREYFESFRGTDFDAWWWQYGGADLTNYPSDVGTLLGGHTADFPRKADQLYARSVKALVRNEVDVTKVAVEAAHSMGIRVDIALRVAAWKVPPPFEEFFDSDFYDAHPEWRCSDRDGTTVMRMSFAVPQVRQHLLGVLREALSSGADGAAIIFFRGLPIILWEDAFCDMFRERYGEDAKTVPEDDPRLYALRCEIITGFMRDVRALLDEVQAQRGTADRLELAAAVLGNEKLCRAFGMDPRRWVQEGLVDSLTSFPWAFHAATKELDLDFFTTITRGTRTQFRPLVYTFNTKNAASLQQDALKWYDAGADGVVLWDAGPTSRYRTDGTYMNPTNACSWPVMSRLGHAAEMRRNLTDGGLTPTHIPLTRIGDWYPGRWMPDVGF